MFAKHKFLSIFPILLLVLFLSSCSKTLKADAGNDKYVNLYNDKGEYYEVILDGSSSQGGKSYEWTQVGGPEVNIKDIKSPVAKFTPLNQTEYKFKLKVLGDGVWDEDETTVTTLNSTTFYVEYPVFSNFMATDKPEITFKGLYILGIAKISAFNNTVGVKVEGVLNEETNTYIISNIPLNEGDNFIDVESDDKGGNKLTKQIFVVYNKSVRFFSSPVFAMDEGLDNEITTTVVSIAIKENKDIKKDGVTLVKADSSNQPHQGVIAKLYDNGDVTNGDDIAGDGVYSSKIVFDKPTEGRHKYRVAVDYGAIEYSAPVCLTP